MKSFKFKAWLSALLVSTVFAAGTTAAWSDDAIQVPVKSIPVASTASVGLQNSIKAGPLSFWNDHPQSAQEWKAWVQHLAELTEKGLPALRAKMGVSVQASQMAGVQVFTVTPDSIAPENQRRVLLHVHGGGYVIGPGASGNAEAIMMASKGHIKVISVDYRMPPDAPYPAALDDVVAVYKELIQSTDPQRLAVFGTSTGGGLTLALALRAKAEGLPMPAALGAGTPWADMDKTGDSYFINENIDNVLVSYEGWLGDAAKLYANGRDLKDPMLSPVYGDVRGFPPTILASGTRDLFLSNTVRMHQKLREAGGVADLIVFEGLSHAQYLSSPDAYETQQYFSELNYFFNKYLAK